MLLLFCSLAGVVFVAALAVSARRRAGGRADPAAVRFEPLAPASGATGRAVVVTGGHGLVGSHVVEALLARGETRVTVFDRADSPLFEAERAAGTVRFVPGDVRRMADVVAAVRGADAVIHAAAVVDPGSWCSFERAAMRGVNAAGAANVVGACRREGVRRLVHLSSCSVVFPRDLGRRELVALDERTPYPEPPYLCNYVATKLEAERIVLSRSGAPLDTDGPGELRTTALRPGGIYGPRDALISREMAAGAPTISYDELPFAAVYVENVVHALLLMEEALGRDSSPVAGQAYFLGDDGRPATYGEVSDAIENACGVPRRRRLPGAVVRGAACLIDALVRLTRGRARAVLGKSAMLRPPTVAMARTPYSFSSDKITRDLGYRPRIGMEEAAARTGAFWRSLAAPGGGKSE